MRFSQVALSGSMNAPSIPKNSYVYIYIVFL